VLDSEDIYVSALLGCVQMAKAGITCFAESGTIEVAPIIQAAIDTGMRANISRMSRDCGDFIPRKFKEPTNVVVKKTEELYKEFNGAGNGRIEIAFSVTSLQTTSPDLLTQVAEASRAYGTILHVHLAEHLAEVAQCLSLYGLRPVEFLERYGALGPNLLGAHSVQLTDREIRILAEYDSKPVHCPYSNLGSHGFPKTHTMVALGLKVGIGTDGASITDLNLFEQMRVLKYSINARYGLPVFDPATLPIDILFKFSTINNAAALGIEDKVGSIEVGKKADIVLLDWLQPHFYPSQRAFPMVVMVATSRDVCDVIIDGRLVVRDRRHQLVDEEEIMLKAKERLDFILKKVANGER